MGNGRSRNTNNKKMIFFCKNFGKPFILGITVSSKLKFNSNVAEGWESKAMLLHLRLVFVAALWAFLSRQEFISGLSIGLEYIYICIFRSVY